MKTNSLKLLIVAFLILSVNLIKAQEAFFITLNGDKYVDKATTVNSENLVVFAIRVLNIPELSKYDMVTAQIRFEGGNNFKTGAYYQLSGVDMMGTATNSKKTPGMKYLDFVVITKETTNGKGYFTIDQYPFEPLDIYYLFSKEGNKNKDSYVMEFELAGQYIESYEEKYEDGKYKKIPVYGKFNTISKTIKITINTTSVVKAKSSKVGSADDLKNMF